MANGAAANSSRRDRAVLALPKVYSSFDNRGKGGTMSSAPRKLWNSSWFEPTENRHLAPAPGYYEPHEAPTKKQVYIARAPRDGRDTLSATQQVTPGPGFYSSVDLDAPFTSFGDLTGGCRTVPPSLKKGCTISKGNRPYTSRAAGTVGEAGQVVDGKVIRGGIPGPQAYTPNFESVIPKKTLGSFIPRSDRFRRPKAESELPGPGTYSNVFPLVKDCNTGPRFSKRRRSLDVRVADGKNLNSAVKDPGPGTYSPDCNHRGKNIGSYARAPTPSAFTVPLEKIYSNNVIQGSS